jgi:hypothetical protein
MIANFFQSLRTCRVEHLLISGQATVLYGAATFSEDIDLWINPSAENCARLLTALRACNARYYKLTPKLTVANLQRGHGFHFVLPSRPEPEAFLDVMGKPPRTPDFHGAFKASRIMQTEWGSVPTVGIKILAELKKTQRLEDYPIISKLSLAWFEQPEASPTMAELGWALENTFTLPELRSLIAEHPEVRSLPLQDLEPALVQFVADLPSGNVPDEIETAISGWMHRRIAELQMADRHYWREIIAELKKLRSGGQLEIEGSAV